MTETRLEEIKRYLRFDQEDAHALRAFRDLASPHFPRIALEFYERIREHEDAHAVLTGEAQTERLKRSLVLWMGRMASAWPLSRAVFSVSIWLAARLHQPTA